MSFPLDFYGYLDKNTLIEVKGGSDRKTFLNIWMVRLGKRIFARSWNKSKKSWFTAIINTGCGEIKYGDKIIKVNGKKLNKNDRLQYQIDNAYIKKYSQTENLVYAKGISQPEYHNYTIEFFYKNDD